MWEWYCNSKEAIEHQKVCKDPDNCEQCVAILATSVAMEEYGTEVEQEPDEPHPLTNYIIDKFGGSTIE